MIIGVTLGLFVGIGILFILRKNKYTGYELAEMNEIKNKALD